LAANPPEPDATVRALFDVRDFFQLPDGDSEYKVAYGHQTKRHFEELRDGLAPQGLTPWLTGDKDECILTLRKKQRAAMRASRIPLIMLLLSLVSIIVFSLLERTIYGNLAPEVSGLVVFFSYSLCVVAVLAGHELGHRYVARRSGETAPASYLIPGIPGVTASLPAVGPLTVQRGPALNRDSFFDVTIWGPLAAFLVSLALYVIGEFSTVISSIPLKGNEVISPYISVNQVNPSAIQFLVDSAFTPFTIQAPLDFVKLSPVADGAAVGFLLTFVSLLPMSSFDGGLLSHSAWGRNASRLATYLSAFVLISLDTQSLSYWAVAIIVLLLAGRQADVQLLDGVSPISRRRKWVYLGAIVLAFLCVPIPKDLLTIPLS